MKHSIITLTQLSVQNEIFKKIRPILLIYIFYSFILHSIVTIKYSIV